MTAPVISHHYAPRGAAKTLLSCRGPEVLLSGPAGTGKSRACLEKLHLMALANPGMRALMVRKTAVSMTSTGLVTFREHVAHEAIEAGIVKWYGGSTQEAACYRYSNGSIINVGGMDRATKIMSSEYDVVYVQEAIELTTTDWEAITTRLRNGKVSFQQLLADTNPDAETHWLKQRCDRGDTLLLESRHEDNPRIFTEAGALTESGADYMSKLDKLTGVRKARLRFGRWVAAEGMVYEDQWDAHRNLIDRFDIPEDWQRYWCVDFGFTNPFVLQCWAEDHDGRLYLYREIYRTRRLVEDHAADILSVVAPGGRWIEPRPVDIICDHDAEDRATLERYLGMSTSAAVKTVSDGIQAVQSRMVPAEDGKARLFMLRDSVVRRDPELDTAGKPAATTEEVPGYVWDEKKDAPVKENDHGLDCMRYMVAHRDLAGEFRVRWL